MSRTSSRWILLVVAGSLVACCGGCGGSSPPPAENAATAPPAPAADPLPVASIRPGDQPASKQNTPADSSTEATDTEGDELTLDKEEVVVEIPDQGTPEWMLREAMMLRLQPPSKTTDVEKLRAERKDRNDKIVKLTHQAIAATHEDKAKARIFNAAVHQLMEARLQLALAGAREDIDALYEDSAALAKREPQSQAAAEGAYTLVNFAYSRAQQASRQDPRWLEEFARQATSYAMSYPREEHRSVPLLFAAARSCELHGMNTEALACYATIQKRFPKNPHAARAEGIVRRIRLTGTSPQIAGPTLDGKQISLADLSGKVVMVVFWSSGARPCQAELPQLAAVHKKYAKQGLSVIGVNLDPDDTPAKQFAIQHQIAWPQICFPDKARRGWNNPLALAYGIMEVPSIWLIDRQGHVVTTRVKTAEVETEILKLLKVE